MSEYTQVVEPVMKEIKRRGGYCVNISPPVEAGTADILACYRGWFIAVECKLPGKTMTPIQRHRADQVRGAHGVHVLAYSKEDIIEVLDSIDTEPGPRHLSGRPGH